ncbi:MAG TPA: hypothetical protein VGM01_06205 [Ktedonobacteraceae bacterium]|jgi:WD40 repeat protein
MKTHRPPCLDWREKLALRHEDLSPADQQALDAHVRTCEACSSALADYHFFEARLDTLPPPAIRPLPRLSPHFFEHTTREQTEQAEALESSTPVSTAKRVARKPNKITRIAWRVLSVAAVLCLLLSAGAIFRVISVTRLASHPSEDTLFNFNQHTAGVTDVAWSPDGLHIATASNDDTVKIWNALTGDLVCTYQNEDEVYALAWSPTSKLIASGSNDNTVHIWNASNCARSNYATYTQTNSVAITSVAWSPDGRFIASGGYGNIAQVWSVSTGKILFSIPFTDVVASIAWSPNGQRIAVGSWDGYTQIWNVQTQQPLQTHNYNNPVNAVAWSPNNRYLAIGTDNGVVEVIDTITEKLVCNYTKHLGPIYSVAWSPDGKYIASGSSDNTVRVWNPFSPETPTLMVYSQHTNYVMSVAWSPNGKEIVSGSSDDTAKVWVVVG